MDNAESEKDFNIKICDNVRHCCETGNLRKPRENDKIDVYAELLLLGSCAERVNQCFFYIFSSPVQSMYTKPWLSFYLFEMDWSSCQTFKTMKWYFLLEHLYILWFWIGSACF